MQRIFSIHILSVVAAFLLLPACKVGRSYERPAVALPEQYRHAPASSDSSMATMKWEEFLPDQRLQALINRALDSNFDLQLAVTRLDEARQYVKQAKVALLPQLQAQATASSTIPSKNSLNGLSLENFLGTNHIEDYNVSLGLSWEIDVWGKIRRQKEAAVAGYLQSEEAVKAVKTALVANVANSYFNLLMLDEQKSIAERNLALSDTIVRIMRLQKTAGEATELAVQQAIVQQQTAALLLPQLNQAIAIQEHALSLLLGDAPGSIIRNSGLDAVQLPSGLLTGVPAALLSNRPDVRADELAVVAANARAGAAQAEMYPSLSITAAGGLNAFKASNWFNMPSSLFGTVAGGLVQPVFQRRRLKTQWEVAKIQREQSIIRFRQTVLQAVREVSDALVSAQYLKEQYTIAEAQTTTLQESIRQAQLLFKSGMANYLEVISVQGRVLQSELSQVQIRRQQLSAQVELYRSLGGGWR